MLYVQDVLLIQMIDRTNQADDHYRARETRQPREL